MRTRCGVICFKVQGGRRHQRDSVAAAADWFAGMMMPGSHKVIVEIRIQNLVDSWGWVSEGDGSLYFLALEQRQTLRAMLQTLMHELIHVRQHEDERWSGDGEFEAMSAEVLADAVWLAGLV